MGALVVKHPRANEGDIRDTGSRTGLGRSPGEGNGYPLLYSCLENPMEREAWWALVPKGRASDTTKVIAQCFICIYTSSVTLR